MTNSAEKYGGLQHFVSELMRDTDHCIENFLFKHNQVLLQMKQDREQKERETILYHHAWKFKLARRVIENLI